jgi:pimeloyl-ACP methyl ester carboxylesterase
MRQREQFEIAVSETEAVRGVLSFDDEAGPDTPTVIFAHGFGSTRRGQKATALEAECARRGWAFAACDFRSHGESDSAMTDLRGSRLIEDLELIVNAVTTRLGGPVFLVGSSMGGWAVAWFTAREPARVKGCALIAPAFHFLEFRSLTKAERKEFQRTGRYHFRNEFVDADISYGLLAEMENYRLEDMAARFRSPLLILHGMRDVTVPYGESLDFVSRCAAQDVELLLFKSGDHRLTAEKDKVARIVCAFFAARLAA